MWKVVSEEHIISIFKVENQMSKNSACRRPSDLLHPALLLGWFSTLKMELIRSTETPVNIQTTRRCFLKDGNINIKEFRLCCRTCIWVAQGMVQWRALEVKHRFFKSKKILAVTAVRCLVRRCPMEWAVWRVFRDSLYLATPWQLWFRWSV
jgi:hypothetical protein